MGENTLALLQHLSSDPDVLPSLIGGYTKPTTVYYSLLGFFFLYSFSTAEVMHTVLLSVCSALVSWVCMAPLPSGQKTRSKANGNAVGSKIASTDGLSVKELLRGAAAAVLGFVGALGGANVVAVIMAKVLGKGMSWFSNEYSTMVLYGPPAVLGASFFFLVYFVVLKNTRTRCPRVSAYPRSSPRSSRLRLHPPHPIYSRRQYPVFRSRVCIAVLYILFIPLFGSALQPIILWVHWKSLVDDICDWVGSPVDHWYNGNVTNTRSLCPIGAFFTRVIFAPMLNPSSFLDRPHGRRRPCR